MKIKQFKVKDAVKIGTNRTFVNVDLTSDIEAEFEKIEGVTFIKAVFKKNETVLIPIENVSYIVIDKSDSNIASEPVKPNATVSARGSKAKK